MPGILSWLNATIYCRIREAITRQQGAPTSLHRSSALSLGSLYSTSILPGSTYCSSSHTLDTKSMVTASHSNAMLGDVYAYGSISSFGSVLDFTKPAVVYFKDRAHTDGAAHAVSFDGSPPDEQLANSFFSPDPIIVGGKPLKMLSGSCYLPHPDKEDTGGEDAHFICTDEQAIGVADGVGGWADVGVNAGLFAPELISNSVRAIQKEPKGSFNPTRVLEKAHANTKVKGSSTACIVALTEKGLHAINLSDSGFIVVRDGLTIFEFPVQQHDFNFPYQLESGNGADLPSSGEVFTIPVASGDAVIAGTDGLFDNLYNSEITGVVVHAIRAQKIAALARQRALSKSSRTPFSTAAQKAGFCYYGGKLDDITVVVSYISRSVSE
ncbi:hypothetical protein JHK87_002120 [Glycine soja]|nr:hypothetical protein JHK87_002120 [Glycine soja]